MIFTAFPHLNLSTLLDFNRWIQSLLRRKCSLAAPCIMKSCLWFNRQSVWNVMRKCAAKCGSRLNSSFSGDARSAQLHNTNGLHSETLHTKWQRSIRCGDTWKLIQTLECACGLVSVKLSPRWWFGHFSDSIIQHAPLCWICCLFCGWVTYYAYSNRTKCINKRSNMAKNTNKKKTNSQSTDINVIVIVASSQEVINGFMDKLFLFFGHCYHSPVPPTSTTHNIVVPQFYWHLPSRARKI